jgi:hypothetical protein
MFLSGEICPSAPAGMAEAAWLVRVLLMGQKSAEAVVPAGIVIAGKG